MRRIWAKSWTLVEQAQELISGYVPDGVPGAIAVNLAILIQDDVSLQVSIVIMSGEVISDNTGRDTQTAQDCDEVKKKKLVNIWWIRLFF